MGKRKLKTRRICKTQVGRDVTKGFYAHSKKCPTCKVGDYFEKNLWEITTVEKVPIEKSHPISMMAGPKITPTEEQSQHPEIRTVKPLPEQQKVKLEPEQTKDNDDDWGFF